ncbi:ATP:cob(I)alamin adenosyltransferase [Candidatus Heimdallarchaeota archaeon B3_Heim]|nr:MAG: ATP:cob(I)alamin adenosyltransferase [Candidatus Heimdallarchaeota archaeon B3_Heim]
MLTGERIEKIDPRIEAYGTVDELITSLGVSKVFSKPLLSEFIHKIQQHLFMIAAELATPIHHFEEKNDLLKGIKRTTSEDVIELETIADELTDQLPPIKNFVIPGGTKSAAFIHQSRTICRRAERHIIRFMNLEEVNPEILRYINRLSDLLFVFSRFANVKLGEGDQIISRHGVTNQKHDSP